MILIIGPRLRWLKVIVIIMHKMVTEIETDHSSPCLHCN